MTVEKLLELAREDRCRLPERWEEGSGLSGKEQLRLAKALVKIKPATIEKHGRRIPCEPRWELKARDRRRLAEAMLDDGGKDGEVLSVVPGLSKRTFGRIRAERDTLPAKTGVANGSSKRQISPKAKTLVVRPWTAYFDATSGGDLEAEKRFRELVGWT